MKSNYWLMLLAILLFVPSRMFAESQEGYWTYDDYLTGVIPKTFTVRSGHPRLLIAPELVDDIKAKIAVQPSLWQKVITKANSTPTISAANYADLEAAVTACGMIYQIGLVDGFTYSQTREGYGLKGVGLLMGIVSVVDSLTSYYPDGVNTDYYHMGMPYGYDWLYALLTPEQRQSVVNKMIARLSKIAAGNAPYGQEIVLGLSFYGDGVNDSAASEIVNNMWNKTLWNIDNVLFYPHEASSDIRWRYSIPSLLLLLEGGGWLESVSYFTFSGIYFHPIYAIKTAMGQDYFSKMGYFRNIPYWLTHGVVPRPDSIKSCYFAFPFYDYTSVKMLNYHYTYMMAAATGFLKDIDPDGASLARWWVDNGNSQGYGLSSPIFGLLMGDPRVVAKSPETMDIDKRLFQKGLNNLYIRSAWNNVDATVIGFGNSRFSVRSNGSNLFSLWKNQGALFPYRGAIVDHDYWGGQTRGDANNDLVFYDLDTNRRTRPIHNTNVVATKAHIGTDREIGETWVYSEPNEYEYVRGSAPKSYYTDYGSNDQRLANVEQAQRTLIYFRSVAGSSADWIAVLDRTKVGNPRNHPHVIYQSVFEPSIGNTWNSTNAGQLIHAGQWKYADSSRVVVTNTHPYDLYGGSCGTHPVSNAHARAFLKVMYPQNVDILKIGGGMHSMDGLFGEAPNASYLLDGTNKFLTKPVNEQILLGGYWRMHIVPQDINATHTILVGIEATDSSVATPSKEIALIESDSILGGVLGGNLVIFAKSQVNKLENAQVTLNANSSFDRMLLCDLLPGRNYTINVGSSVYTKTASSQGTVLIKNISVQSNDLLQIIMGDVAIPSEPLNLKVR